MVEMVDGKIKHVQTYKTRKGMLGKKAEWELRADYWRTGRSVIMTLSAEDLLAIRERQLIAEAVKAQNSLKGRRVEPNGSKRSFMER